jgi:type I restriction enzyme S subunit
MSRANTADLVGRSVIVERAEPHLMLSDKIIRCEFVSQVNREFVNYFNRASIARNHYRENASGTSDSMKNISREVILTVPVPLPPLAEQKRIVAKVAELMALCDDLEARQNKQRETAARLTTAALGALTSAQQSSEFESTWARVQAELPVLLQRTDSVVGLRTAIRGLACNGRLSACMRSQEEPTAGQLLDAIMLARSTQRRKLIQQGVRPASLPREGRHNVNVEPLDALPTAWAYCGIDDILACRPNALKAGPFGSALTKSMYVPRGYKVYGQEQVIPGNHQIGSYYVDEAKYQELRSCAVEPGDFLVSLMGTVGKVLLLPDNCERGIINPRLLKLTLDERIHAPYIKLYLESPQAHDFFEDSARGVAMDGLNIAILRELPVALPPRAEQVWLVVKVDQLMKLCDALEAALRHSEDVAGKLADALVAELVA